MATRKTTTTAKANVEEAVSKFEELRQRAKDAGGRAAAVTDTPFILGEDWGFEDNPIEVSKPSFFVAQAVTRLYTEGAVLDALGHLITDLRDVNRVVQQLDQLGDDAAAASVLLIEDILVHFYGAGAARVFPRSAQ